jgi:hypothetical protein
MSGRRPRNSSWRVVAERFGERILSPPQRPRQGAWRYTEQHAQAAQLHRADVEAQQHPQDLVMIAKLGRVAPRSCTRDVVEASKAPQKLVECRPAHEHVAIHGKYIFAKAQRYLVRLVAFRKLMSVPYLYSTIHAESHGVSKHWTVK